MLAELPPEFVATRNALHALGEHVLSAAYWHATTHIGLRPTPRGLGTPVFGDAERVRVDATALVHERGGAVRRHELTTLAAAAAFVGIPLGAPTVYTPTTHLAADLDQPSTELQIWPEHFDLAGELGQDGTEGRANYGASPGDDSIGEPYLYVGPHEPARRTGVFTRCPFGAAITYSELRQAAEAGAAGRQFYESAVEALVG